MIDLIERLQQLTPAQQAQLARRLQTDGGRYGVAPLSFTQQRMWLLDQFDPGSPAYHVCGVFELDGALDVAALEAALGAMVDRHAALRTAYLMLDGQVIQSVRQDVAITLEHVDLSALPELERRGIALQRARERADAPFDLTQPLMMRATLLRLAPQSHWLVLTIHHIACDMVSMGIIQRDLMALYDSRRQGASALALPEAAYQYTDFCRWQREAVDGPDIAAQGDHWRQRLAGMPARLDLPVDRPPPARPSLRGVAAPYQLDSARNRALRELAQRRRATPFMAMLAAYAAWLGRHAGQRDVVIGSPISNRTRPEWAQVVGYFLNTLLLRIDLGGRPTFEQLIDRVREVCLDAYAHADLPFERLVDLLQPGREMSRRPLFQALFVHQHRPPSEVVAAGLVWRHVDLPIHTMVADIGLWSVDATTELDGFMACDADLFDAATTRRFATRLQALLGELVAHPQRPLDRTPWFDDSERRAIVAVSSGPHAQPCELCLHELIAEQAIRTPQAPALSFDGGQLSYRDLDHRANALAHRLHRAGVGPESRVAVMVERSPELVLGLLAVLKAGGAYVPLDPDYPPQRLAYMLKDCGAQVLLATRKTVASLGAAGAGLTTLLLDELAAEQAALPPPSGVRPDHLAYVIYTSGSTGRPKGAMNNHRGVVNRLRWMQQTYRLDATDRVLQKTPSSFDVSVWEFFWPLLAGATLVLARPGGHRDPAYLVELIRSTGITTLHFVPSMFRAFVDQPGIGALSSLRRVFCSGEALTPDLVQRFAAASSAELHNLYGPTEAAIDVTHWSCSRQDGTVVPIGYPVANTQIHILDEQFEPVPVGVPGELCIGGAQVGRGYLGRPGLTAERFVPDPFAGGGARLYRTGDRARRRADGAIEYLGRDDDQVKVRGWRIELGEIESALNAHPQVAAAAVLARPGPSGEPMLLGYVERRSGQESAVDDVQHIGDWAAIYDRSYGGADTVDPTFDTRGWNSSYDGQPVPAPQMRAYVESRVAAVLALKPRRVLEIGCGTGLIVQRLAPHCERYVATDISQVALARVADLAAADAALAHVELLARDALDLTGWEDAAFDTVVLNSVSQHFPSTAYLEKLLDALQRVVAAGGCIFIGDVRRLDLQRLLHVSVQAHRGGTDCGSLALRQRVEAAIAREQDLVLSLDLFGRWAGRDSRRHAVFELERGAFDNEFTRFRCDALLFLDRAPVEGGPSMAWADLPDLDAIAQQLSAASGLLRVVDIPNARLSSVVALERWLDGHTETVADVPGGVSTEDLHRLAGGAGCSLSLRPARSGLTECMDAQFRPANAAPVAVSTLTPPVPGACGAPLSNEGWRCSDEMALSNTLAEHLRQHLPAHMVPERFIMIERMPLSPSGKVDRQRLPEPPAPTGADATAVAPRDETERRLLAIWEALLGVRGFGVRDSFFALGGQSILAARLMARIQNEFQRSLPLATLFEGPTIEHLAQRLALSDTAPASALVTIRAGAPRSPATVQPLPFFCVHAGGGSVLAYQALAANLLPADAEQPPRAFFAFQAAGMDGRDTPQDRFEDMAARYVAEMRKVQPRGPYLLGGWCTGGRIAQVMAQQLEASGDSVAMLALFDASAIAQGLPDGKALDDTSLLASMSPRFAAAAASVAQVPPDARLAAMLERLRADALVPPEAGLIQVHAMLRVFRAILRAERRHAPAPTQAAATLFRAAQQPPGAAADLGWSPWLRAGCDIIDVPGDHLSMMEDPAHAAVLARAVERVLARAEASITGAAR